MKVKLIAISMALAAVSVSNMSFAQVPDLEQNTNDLRRVSKAEFKKYLDEHKNVQLIDVRTAGEFGEGTIQGAKNIDFYSPEFKNEISKLNKDVPTMIFCRSGGRSAQALEIFRSQGFQVVYELEGGFMNW